MNIYVLVEGKVEKSVYKEWIPLVNPDLNYVHHPSHLTNNHFVIVSAMGYPTYLQNIEYAAEDVVSNPAINRLVVAIDSEEMTRVEKYDEVQARIHSIDATMDYRIIVQHFCLETWALGNRRVVGVLPQEANLKRFKSVYDVRVSDPEGLPAHKDWNRAQFAYQYLRAAFRDRWGSLTYSKSNPRQLRTKAYFDQLEKRLSDTGHIDSFRAFNTAFS